MAEAIVSLAIERITDLLIQEAKYLSGVREEVTRLKDELKRMQCFLKDADSKQDQDERVHNWVAEIRGIAYDAEDVIDTFILKASAGRGKGAHELIKSFTSTFTKGFHFHKIGNQIEAIRTKIGDISASMQTYGIQFVTEKEGSSSTTELQQRLRRSYPHEEEHVVSFEPIARELKTQLMKEEDRLCVVSVAGMGGLGKTTLAKKLYNDFHVKQHFDCSGWAFVSQQVSVTDIVVRIMIDVASSEDKSKFERREEKKPFEKMKDEQSFKSVLESMDEEDLIKKLYEVLDEKRYLVVLDDIWSNQAWDYLKHAFPKGKKGSKVLFTTRNREVASYADPWSSPLEPPLLTSEESWELLSRKAFAKDVISKHGYSPEIEKLGKEMVKKCGGLPLAVVVLGGLLATKKSLNEWEGVHRNINAQFTKLQQHHQYGGVYGLLALSYRDLPFHLKPCFLYFSQFPEDWEFHKRSLIRLWIAEGFVSQTTQADGDETVEDVAEQYLEELVSRCMVQVSERDHTGTGIKIFRVHDLMRDMCISKARDENFAALIEHQDSLATNNSSCFLKSSATNIPRRIAAHSRIFGYDGYRLLYAPLVKADNLHLRSLLYFVEKDKYRMNRSQETYIYKKFGLLRILNLSGISLYDGHMNRALGNLIHLRHLGLRYCWLRERTKSCFQSSAALPESIGNLKNLHTIDLRDNHSRIRLPNALWKLENLRHLLLPTFFKGPLQLNNLKHLETLKWVPAKNLIEKEAVLEFPNLRNLVIAFERRKEVEVIFKSSCLSKLASHCRSLKIFARRATRRFPSLEWLSGCHHLTKLLLRGEIAEDLQSLQHNQLEFLPKSLAKLSLMMSNLKQDPMGILEKLPNLRFLSLQGDAYVGSKMVCSANGFLQLEFLRLGWLSKVEEWEIEEGALPRLRTLQVDHPKCLKMIPEGLKFVTTIQELELTELEEELIRRVQAEDRAGGEDFHKIQHIPSITVTRLMT